MTKYVDLNCELCVNSLRPGSSTIKCLFLNKPNGDKSFFSNIEDKGQGLSMLYNLTARLKIT